MSVQLIVLLKPVVDNTQLRFSATGEPVLAGAATMMNPYDEYALEAALTLKEGLLQGGEPEVSLTAVTVAQPFAKETLKKAIAAGADAAVLLSDPTFDCCPSGSPESPVRRGQILAAIIQKIGLGAQTVILAGQSALDSATGATAVLVAEALNARALTGCLSVSVNTDQTLNVNLEQPDGSERYLLDLKTGPWVLSCAKGTQELRSANIKGVMRANKTEITAYTLADLGMTADQVGPSSFGQTVVSRLAPPPKRAGRLLDASGTPAETAKQLVAAIKALG